MKAVLEGFLAQLSAHFVVLFALVGSGVVVRFNAAVRACISSVGASLRGALESFLVSWEEMLPPWWRGWLFGLLTAALVMDVVALIETAIFGAGAAVRAPSRVAAGVGAGAGTAGDPRVARDDAWAALLRARWAEDARLGNHLAASRLSTATMARVEYGDGPKKFFGDVFVAPELEGAKRRLPGVVLFHTAAGPRDLFLAWKAELLAARGCIVLVADLFSDERGDGCESCGPRGDLAGERFILKDSERIMRDMMGRLELDASL